MSKISNQNILDSYFASEVTTSISLDHLQPQTPKEIDHIKGKFTTFTIVYSGITLYVY